jgi:hypothetical protein
MLHIPNSNAYIKLNLNDTRPESVRSKDVLISHKELDLKTGENIIIFSRTTPEKIAKFKSLKPLMLAARNEIDTLNKQAYLKKYGTDISSAKLKNFKHLLSISTENKFSTTEKQLKESLDINKPKTDQDTLSINKLSNSEAKSVKISKKALSAEAFEQVFKKSI